MQGNQKPWPAAVFLVLLAITGCSQTPTSGPVTPTPGPATPTLQAMTPTPLPPATVEDYPWPPTRAPAPTRTPTPTETPLPPTVPPTPAPTPVPPTPLPPYAPEGELPDSFPPVVYVVQRPQQATQIWSLQYKEGLLQEELLVDLSPADPEVEEKIRVSGYLLPVGLTVSPNGRYVELSLLGSEGFGITSLIVGIDGSKYLSFPVREAGRVLDWIPGEDRVLMADSLGHGWWTVNIDGSDPVVWPGQLVADAVITPDGNKAIFSAAPNSGVWLGTIDLYGENMAAFSPPDPLPGSRVQNLALPSSGQRCAFTWVVDSNYYGSGPIWIINVDGSNQRLLGSGDTYDYDLVWSPDGRTLAFSRREDRVIGVSTRNPANLVGSLWLIDIESGEERQILSSEGQYSSWSPQWLPDGSGLVFLSNRGGEGNVWFVRPDGSGLQQLTRQGGVVGELALLPR